MFKTVNALVLREVRYKEADRILTLLTDTDGKITVKARGALRKSSKTAAATQQLTYSEMTLFGNLGRWTVNEATVKEGFDGLRTDIGSFALGCYFAECADALSAEDQPDAPLLAGVGHCRVGPAGEYQVPGRLGLGGGEHRRYQAVLHHLAIVQDGHVGADLLHHAHLVGDDHHGDAQLRLMS